MNAALLASLGAIELAHREHGPALAAEQLADETSGVPLLGSPSRWGFPIVDDAGALEPCHWRSARRWCQCFRCPGSMLYAREIVAGRGLPAWLEGTPAAAEAHRLAASALHPTTVRARPVRKASGVFPRLGGAL
ncbi:MAG: hypothetical protein EPO40_06140 [Myxococcaceae bacterium]|nr:MAG: hypothetical protein EPO40_06140 [Myxococcaceae bacterium]